jgi:hypothetical protein
MNLLVLIIIIIFIIVIFRYNNTPIDVNETKIKNIEKDIIVNKNILNNKVKQIKDYLKPNIDINPNEYKYDLKTDVNLYTYDDIFEFTVNTQDFYTDNESAYESFIYNLKIFMKIYEILLVDPSYSNLYFVILRDRRKIILNHFSSLRIKYKGNEDDINTVIDDLKKILDKYYNHIIKLHNKHINEVGYTHQTYIIDNSNIDPYNEYDKYVSTFNIY